MNIGKISYFTNEEKIEIINFTLKYSKGCVFINTINKVVALFICENYPTYYFHEVPIGYYSGFQYHLCIQNTVNKNDNCKTPSKENNKVIIQEKIVEKVVVEEKIVEKIVDPPIIQKVINGYAKTRVERILRKVIKNKNINDEFVDEYMRELKVKK